MIEPHSQSPHDRSPPRLRWLLAVGLGVVVLYGAYEGVLALVRSHVNKVIARTHGEPLPDFELRDTKGDVFRREDLLGKVVVLHFMRSHCHSCELEKPEIRKFEQELSGSDVVLLSVMLDSVMGFSAEATAATLERCQFGHPILIANDAFVDALHGTSWAKVTPITYLVNRQGNIVVSLRGAQDASSLHDAVAEAQES
jgi:peroxiredoxin